MQAGRYGGEPAYHKRSDRRLGVDGPEAKAAEAAMLVDPSARLGSDGSYGPGPSARRSGETVSVLGVGLDVVDVTGFAEQLGRPGTRFVVGAFTPGERSDSGEGSGPRLAARWAAKEAFLKAWSSARYGAPPALSTWNPADIEVVVDLEGRPALRLHGDVALAVENQWGENWRAHLSLTHDGPFSAAVVVLESDLSRAGIVS